MDTARKFLMRIATDKVLKRGYNQAKAGLFISVQAYILTTAKVPPKAQERMRLRSSDILLGRRSQEITSHGRQEVIPSEACIIRVVADRRRTRRGHINSQPRWKAS